MSISTADLYDERGEELLSLALQFQDVGGLKCFRGQVRTVRCLEDNALLKSVLSTNGDGAVLVVDGGGSLRTALMGDMIARLALDNGWSGALVNGAIRDRAVISAMPFGLKALGSNPRKSAKKGTGEVDVPVTIGGIVFRPGARIYCDEDGVLVER